MPRATSTERLRARANAYQEVAEHLDLAWTDGPTEPEEGDRLTRLLQAECVWLRATAAAREFGKPRLMPN